MMRMKSGPMFDPQSARNQCKLIWDSASGPRNKLPVKKKVGFTSDSSVTVKESLTQSRYPRRNSLVATRISFYEERPEPQTDDEVIQTENDGNHSSEVQVKISFDDHATTTFEYEGEEAALETYLQEHPDEKDQAENESIVNGVSDTIDEPVVPSEPETHMKSNTVLGTGGGGLTSYKSKMQTLDFQFGMTPEPEPEIAYSIAEPEDDSEGIDLLPADDNELDAFSAEVDKADMLF